ncbi:hypothetical protein P153DRAFT_387524 [Dothidotthia symphoricarpi CBS 119687]|uniref:Uncharacterized protein n=1 Tax=Dothidotthia symphoricarpi CBS 119687 TaxID=1392245 RepID=A0A6A6A6Z8_9PLEO|nr:uncharacterized protein P153DRAFT_387524 [Dothidotthia symphoricarpi CBS 119687]KAF2127792.1 hypothetical protein P153DRAFT_387524 [Dothidotthia symphoricarpi CBS 119687]
MPLKTNISSDEDRPESGQDRSRSRSRQRHYHWNDTLNEERGSKYKRDTKAREHPKPEQSHPRAQDLSSSRSREKLYVYYDNSSDLDSEINDQECGAWSQSPTHAQADNGNEERQQVEVVDLTYESNENRQGLVDNSKHNDRSWHRRDRDGVYVQPVGDEERVEVPEHVYNTAQLETEAGNQQGRPTRVQLPLGTGQPQTRYYEFASPIPIQAPAQFVAHQPLQCLLGSSQESQMHHEQRSRGNRERLFVDLERDHQHHMRHIAASQSQSCGQHHHAYPSQFLQMNAEPRHNSQRRVYRDPRTASANWLASTVSGPVASRPDTVGTTATVPELLHDVLARLRVMEEDMDFLQRRDASSHQRQF